MTERTGTYAIISTHIAWADSVSLEILKWADVIERNDVECCYIAGELDRPHQHSRERTDHSYGHSAGRRPEL